MHTNSRLLADVTLGKIESVSPLTEAASDGAVGALTTAETVISWIFGILTILAGIYFVFYFVTAALNWITSNGEKGKIQKARDQITQGAIGLVLIVMAYAIVGLIGSLLGLKILRPAEMLVPFVPVAPGS